MHCMGFNLEKSIFLFSRVISIFSIVNFSTRSMIEKKNQSLKLYIRTFPEIVSKVSKLWFREKKERERKEVCISHATLNQHDSTEATSTLVRQAHLKKYFISIGSTFSGHTGYTSDLVAWISQRGRSSEAEFREANRRLANDSLLCFITNVLRFENSRRGNRGVREADITGLNRKGSLREEMERIHEPT